MWANRCVVKEMSQSSCFFLCCILEQAIKAAHIIFIRWTQQYHLSGWHWVESNPKLIFYLRFHWIYHAQRANIDFSLKSLFFSLSDTHTPFLPISKSNAYNLFFLSKLSFCHLKLHNEEGFHTQYIFLPFKYREKKSDIRYDKVRTLSFCAKQRTENSNITPPYLPRKKIVYRLSNSNDNDNQALNSYFTVEFININSHLLSVSS